MGDAPREDDPGPAPPKTPRPPQERRKTRDLGREDADSPCGIPLLPPQGDGS